MAKRTTLNLDTKNIEQLILKLDELEGDVKSAVEDALTQAAETITDDTIDAMHESNLPAGGEYSDGETKESIVKNPKVIWEGTKASVAVGFDYDKPGAGGYLITGTPRMRPVQPLNVIYTGKRYMTDIRKDMEAVMQDYINEKMGGK